MSFPSIRDGAISNSTVVTTTPIINLPSIVLVGDILLFFIRSSSAGVLGLPVGWTTLFNGSFDASSDRMACAFKVADGSEGGTTINLTSGNAKFVAFSVSVRDSSGTLTLGSLATGGNPNQPNAGNCNPGSLKDYLFLTFFGMEGEQTGISSYPSNYILDQTGLITTSTAGAPASNCTTAASARQLSAVSEDSGPWSILGGLRNWTAGTIAFHPIVVPSEVFLPNGGSSLPY